MYGSETWAMKAEDMQRLERTERMMVRLMCGVTLRDRKRSEELLSRLDIEGISEVVRRGRLRWYGHVERKDPTDWVSACRGLVVEGARGRACLMFRGPRLFTVDELFRWRRLLHGTVCRRALGALRRRMPFVVI